MMIRADELHTYQVRMERFDRAGFYHGVSHFQVLVSSGWAPYWWCGCRACGRVAVLAVAEVGKDRECGVCGFNLHTDVCDFDWTVDRTMRSWELHQETFTSAWLLGGVEAVQALGKTLHQEVLASQAKHEARRKLGGPDPQP